MTSQVRVSGAVAGIDPATACAEIDLAAFRSNVATLRAHAGVPVMVVVKADGYGHGMIECAREARAAGAEWLGVATPAEALQLREAGDTGPTLAWLYGVDEDLTPLVAAEVDVSAQSVEQIGRLVVAAAAAERRARVHLKIDTGLSRNGATSDDWQQVCAIAAEAERAGAIEVVAIWSHLAAADEPGHPSVPLQIQAFQQAYEQGRAAGLEPTLRHLGNSAGALVVPEARLDLVRVGIAAYGRRPGSRGRGARRSYVAAGDAAARSAGQCQGHSCRSRRLVRVDLGRRCSHDGRSGAARLRRGIPRHAGNRAFVGMVRRRAPVRRPDLHGPVRRRVALGMQPAQSGDEVIVFGRRDQGEPTAADWAAVVRHHRLRDCDADRDTGAAPIPPRQSGRHLMAPKRSQLARGLGLIASVAGAPSAGGVALGVELERRIVSKRLARKSDVDVAEFFALRADGPDVITPDGVVLHTEVDEGEADDITLVLVHGYALNLDCWHFQRVHFRGQLRQVLYDLAFPRQIEPLRG